MARGLGFFTNAFGLFMFMRFALCLIRLTRSVSLEKIPPWRSRRGRGYLPGRGARFKSRNVVPSDENRAGTARGKVGKTPQRPKNHENHRHILAYSSAG